MKLNRRSFVTSLAAIAIIGIQQNEVIVSAKENKGWFDELTSTVKGSIVFVDDVRASLKRQGTEIDRQKLKPSVSELNMAVNALLFSLTSMKKNLEEKGSTDSEISVNAFNLSPKANRMIRAMEDMFKRMSTFDTALYKHKSTIYQLSLSRAMSVDEIKTLSIRPTAGKIDLDALRLELNNAIKIGNLLLQSIQGLIKELG